ncbi:MAG: carbohydrate-binding domain-containing protein, partial [Prevotellaceae bacterium]|nr:carbohydrate-binding domain-containing protein [Prevotellaceae bacterium]
MKRLILSLAISLTALLVAAEVEPTKFWVWVSGEAHEYGITSSEELLYSSGTLSIGSDVYQLNEVDSITFCAYEEVADEQEQEEEEDEAIADTVYVAYSGSEAQVSSLPACVEAEIDGADVSLTNSDTSRELCFVLSGSSSCGSFVYNGSYKTTICLDGLTLTGSSAEAINIKDGKRIALVLADGTENTLEDASEDGGQKAALYTKGHLEISGGGSLSLKGNVKHALSSKEYLLVKKTAGSITVSSAANDGIHAGQYVQVNGGTIKVSGVGGDGIQAEMQDDGSEDDGKLIIKGGTLDVSVSSDDCAALKSDSTLHIKGGDITIRSTGSDDKGLKSKQSVSIEGGTLRVTQSGSYLVEDGEASYTTAIKADADVSITGGEISITNSADAGKGISADGDITISEDDSSVTLTVSCTGTGEPLDESKTAGSSSGEEQSFKVYVNVPTSTSNNGGGGGPGGNSSSSAWSNVYLYSSSGTKVAQLTTTATLTSGNTSKTFYVYDFGQATSGTYYFASDDYTSMGMNKQTYSIKSGTFTGPSSGSPSFYVISSSYSTSGSTRTYTITDETSTYSSYSVGSTSGSSSSETVAPACLKADGSLS